MTSVPDLRTEAAMRDAWLEARLESVVPMLMEQAEGIDAWIVAGREYNEDPVLTTMLPATWLNARRRTVLVFTDRGRTRATIARYAVGTAFPAAWDPGEQPDQWAAVAAFVAASNPTTVALDTSPHTALADGLSASEMRGLMAALGPLTDRVIDADALAIGWLDTYVASETDALREACGIAHDILRRALSREAITPGDTTTADVEWWMRERVRSLGFGSWFHPTVSVQRSGGQVRTSFSTAPGPGPILSGDLVHIDFGIVHLGLHTDQQQHGYVLRPGEAAAPEGLLHALAGANRVQDLLLGAFADGRSGNAILADALAAARGEGLRPKIYTHPIGLHGHAAGPTIGLWDQQDGVPGAGDLVVHPNTAYSIELSATAPVAEWDQDVVIMLEEEAYFDGDAIGWLDGRQTDLHLI